MLRISTVRLPLLLAAMGAFALFGLASPTKAQKPADGAVILLPEKEPPLTTSIPVSQKKPDQKNPSLPPPNRLPPEKNKPSSRIEAPPTGSARLGQVMPISLPIALRLAQTTNLDIAQARELVNQARAGLDRARVLYLPSLNLGSTYVDHEGNIQRTEGNVIKANRDSLFAGGGPSMVFGFADVVFLPLAARQALAATQAGFTRVNNDTLLSIADVYFVLLRARRRLAKSEEALDHLLSTRASAMRSQSKGLFPLVRDFVELGGAQALRSELERVRVDVLRRQEERVQALQDFRIASAELARLIRLDPSIPLWPVEDFRRPINLPGEAWLNLPLEELARVALNNRPEIAENQALVQAALARLRNARFRPWMPNLILNYNWGDFGGGPDPNPPIQRGTTTVTQPGFGPSGRISHFGTRSDFDVSLVWRFQNMGLGNLAEIREQQSIYRRTELRRMQVQDQVVAQVVQAYEAVQGWRERLAMARTALFDSAGRTRGPVFQSLRLNFDRVFNQPGTRPLETLDSIRRLNDVLETYAQVVSNYEAARFRLLVSLGLPAQGYWNPQAMPSPNGSSEKDKQEKPVGAKQSK